MKISLIILSILFGTGVWSQSIPDAATEHFNYEFNSHTEASNIVWKAVDNGFEVTYDFYGRQGYAFYDDKGMCKESRIYTTFDRLAEGTQEYITSTYPNGTVTYCYRLNTQTAPERSVVQLQNNGQSIKLFFRPDGTFHYQE